MLIIARAYSTTDYDQFYFNKISAYSSLGSFYVTQITQDSTGYIWLGTLDGVSRYDGQGIKVYKAHDGKKESGLIPGNIQSVLVDSKDRLWISTQMGISIYNKELDKFEIVASITELNGLLIQDIKNIIEDRENNIIVTAGDGIYKYNEYSKSFEIIFQNEYAKISSILMTDTGVWIGYFEGRGLEFYKSLNQKEPTFKIASEIKDINIHKIIDYENQLWVAAGIDGLIVIDKEIGKIVDRFYHTDEYRPYVVNLRIDKKNNLWVIDYTGIKRYLAKENRFVEYYNYPELPYSLQQNVVDIFEDSQNNFYTIHNGVGVHVSPFEVGFSLMNSSELSKWQLTKSNISAISEDKFGRIWVGSFDGGIDIFDPKTNSKKNIADNKTELETGSVMFIYRDSNGDMWTNSYMHGLKKYNYHNDSFTTWKSDKHKNSLAHNDIRAISEDEDKNLWLGTHGAGVDYFNYKKNSFTNYNNKNNNLISDWVNDIMLDETGRLWVATTYGVSVLDKGDSIFNSSFNEDSNLLKGSEVTSIEQDNNKVIWVGTNHGLHYFDKELQEFVICEYIPLIYISSIKSDASNVLWIGTHDGLIKLNIKEKSYNVFDEYDGLQGKDFNPRSSYIDSDKKMYFGGTSGLSMFCPKKLKYNDTPPKIRFSRLLLFNEPVESYGEKSILSKELNSVDELVLEYKQNFFTIEFVALNFINPVKNQYACKMDGFDDDWIYMGDKRSVSYTNLFPGKYVFRVKASNNHGVWNEEGISLVIIIKPPWYLSKWFIIVAFLFLSMLLLLIHKLRVRALRIREIQLTDIVQERTLQLKESNMQLQHRADELKNINYVLEERQNTIISQSELLRNQAKSLHESNVELKQLVETRDKLMSIIAHDLRSPFNTILGFTGLLTDAFDASNPERMKQYARYIHDASISVFNLLENLLYWARTQTERIDVKPDFYYLDNIVEETLLLVKESAAKKMITIDESGYKNHKVYMDVDMMNSVFRNLIINAIKFTPQEGSIKISTSLHEKHVEVKIEDTGVGMSAESINALYKRLTVRSKPGTSGEKGVGLGLALSYEFIIKNGGDLKIDSIIGEGSKFIFTIPLNPPN